MRLVFAGTPAAALPSLDALLRSRHDVVAVLTRPDAPAGRGRRLVASPVAQRAPTRGIEVLTAGETAGRRLPRRDSRRWRPTAARSWRTAPSYPRVALDVPRHGWVNLHFSLLPAWRGAAPVQHAICTATT